jgi:hypothetical protein
MRKLKWLKTFIIGFVTGWILSSPLMIAVTAWALLT